MLCGITDHMAPGHLDATFTEQFGVELDCTDTGCTDYPGEVSILDHEVAFYGDDSDSEYHLARPALPGPSNNNTTILAPFIPLFLGDRHSGFGVVELRGFANLRLGCVALWLVFGCVDCDAAHFHFYTFLNFVVVEWVVKELALGGRRKRRIGVDLVWVVHGTMIS
ncbi:unnamed protein product [Hydatigera taeniaeformis]|uniref:Uncharacterized protein n=1 Tax=Hydatigena taeniaeformis TaxID=6205 RepID=A0A0R3X3H2_HYDTA|nr:unnamed protein product [Hydatigera taeniaeformis]